MKDAYFHIKVAKTLLNTATLHKVEDKVAADMEGLADLMRHRDCKVLLQSVTYMAQEAAEKVLHATFHGKVNDLTLKLLYALASQKAIKYLGKIAEIYRKHYHQAKGIKEITIRTAREFSPQEQLSFVKKLQDKKKHPVTVKFEVDQALVAGAQIYENSYVTDYSVKNYLETLQKHLTSQQF